MAKPGKLTAAEIALRVAVRNAANAEIAQTVDFNRKRGAPKNSGLRKTKS